MPPTRAASLGLVAANLVPDPVDPVALAASTGLVLLAAWLTSDR